MRRSTIRRLMESPVFLLAFCAIVLMFSPSAGSAADQGPVLGFPSNDFGGQEPGTAKEIRKFCQIHYGATFPMFSKVVTRPGPSQSPAYAFLGSSGHLPGWNFSKYVVGRDGQVVAFFPSEVAPDSPGLRAAIDMALAAAPR